MTTMSPSKSQVLPRAEIKGGGGLGSPPAPTASSGVPSHSVATASANTLTLASAHSAIISVGIEVVFVFIMYIIAGLSPGAGKVVVAIFVLLIIFQGVSHVSAFQGFVQSQPVTAGG